MYTEAKNPYGLFQKYFKIILLVINDKFSKSLQVLMVKQSLISGTGFPCSGSVGISNWWVPKGNSKVKSHVLALSNSKVNTMEVALSFPNWWVPEPIIQKLMGYQKPKKPMLTEPLPLVGFTGSGKPVQPIKYHLVPKFWMQNINFSMDIITFIPMLFLLSEIHLIHRWLHTESYT